MFSVKKDLSLKRNREHTRFHYWKPQPVLYVSKLGFFDYFKIPVKVQNISKSGLLAKIKTKGTFTVDETIIIEFGNYCIDIMPTTVMRWDAEHHLLAVKFGRKIKLTERMSLNMI